MLKDRPALSGSKGLDTLGAASSPETLALREFFLW
jgi:hypothetical protein